MIEENDPTDRERPEGPPEDEIEDTRPEMPRSTVGFALGWIDAHIRATTKEGGRTQTFAMHQLAILRDELNL